MAFYNRNYLLIVSLAIWLLACNTENTTTEQPNSEATATATATDAHTHSVDHEASEALPLTMASELIIQYLQVKDALVAGDADMVATKANALRLTDTTAIHAIEPLLAHWREMADQTDIESQRKAFEDVSIHMYNIAKANTGNTVLYKQYCPMAFDNTGAYWLSDEATIMNPYFGDAMLHCGTVQETIGD